MQAEVSARTASDSVLNSERVKGSLRRFAPLTRCGTEDRDERRAAAKKDRGAAARARSRRPKCASTQKSSTAGRVVFFILRQALEATSKNALNYDKCVSGAIIYAYVQGNPLSYVDPEGLQGAQPAPMLRPAPRIPGPAGEFPYIRPEWNYPGLPEEQ